MDPLREAARRDPYGEAVVLHGRGDAPGSWSWAELDDRVDAVALHLAEAGVAPGEPVLTLLPSSPEGFVLLHALPRVGAFLVPLHPGWPPAEVARAVSRVAVGPGRPHLVASRARIIAGFGTVGGAHDPVENLVWPLPVEEIPGLGDEAEAASPAGLHRPTDVPLDPDAPVAVLLTSGSSGPPRPVPLTRGNMLASARAGAERLRLDPADRWLASLALAHVGGLQLLYRGTVVGSTTVFDGEGGFEPPRFLALADRGEVTHASLVPVMLQRLLEARGGAPAPRGLRTVLLGGAATPRPLLEEALRCRWPVALTWGMTEAASQVATAPPDQVRRKPGTVGRPLAGVTVRVVGPGGRALPRGEVGELQVSGPTVAPLPEVARRGGWHATGDLGHFDAEGDLWITGRASERIISGGVTVEPGEVEAVLLTHPSLREVAVVGQPDPTWGERVVAFVVPFEEAPLDLAALEAFARAHLAPAKRPRSWKPRQALPRNANGKVDRRALQSDPSGSGEEDDRGRDPASERASSPPPSA